MRIFQPKRTRLKFNLSVFLFFFLITSCGSKKIIYNQPEKKSLKKIEKNKSIDTKKPNIVDTNTQMKVYVLLYSDLAIKEMNKFGIPASIKLAQALLESQAGKGELALKSNKNELVEIIKKRSIIYSKALYKINCDKLSKHQIAKKIIKIYETY